ncbi:MAG: selenium-dependent molybdenum cofactor biosynthesis protein YqeB [Anaerolineae bacterium]|nr:selenium-dependent molybdenum cofactor biosynthesis protein YqeB [Anaerolineae bacterium]
MSFRHGLVLIKGAGDLASGVAWRLHRCGFPVVMTEIAQPLAVRRGVAFAQAVYAGEMRVEGVTARRVEDIAAARAALEQGIIPVLVDPQAACRTALRPAVLVDGIMAKVNTGTSIEDAPLVIALGPGFTAGVDCHAVVETNRGHDLGRVLWSGSTTPDTGVPGEIGGQAAKRVLRAPCAGWLHPLHAIGDRLEAGEVVARVDGEEVRAPFAGVLRGLIHESVPLTPGMKIGDVDPRATPEHCFTISDKSLAIAGGVLEAILSAPQLRPLTGILWENPSCLK